MSDEVVDLLLRCAGAFRKSAEAALAIAERAHPASATERQDLERVRRYFDDTLRYCHELDMIAMGTIGQRARDTAKQLQGGVARLQKIQDRIAAIQRVVDFIADLATTSGHVVALFSTGNVSQIPVVIGDIDGLVEQATAHPPPTESDGKKTGPRSAKHG